MLTQFQEKAQKAIVIAESIAYDLGHSSVGSEHLLLSLLKMKDSTFSKTMKKYQVDDSLIYKDMMRLFGEKDAQLTLSAGTGIGTVGINFYISP